MGQKAVTRNLTGNPAEHSCEWTAKAKAQLNRRQPEPAKPGCQAGSKTDMGQGAVTGLPRRERLCRPPLKFTRPAPAKSAVLTAATNGDWERSNPPASLLRE